MLSDHRKVPAVRMLPNGGFHGGHLLRANQPGPVPDEHDAPIGALRDAEPWGHGRHRFASGAGASKDVAGCPRCRRLPEERVDVSLTVRVGDWLLAAGCWLLAAGRLLLDSRLLDSSTHS